jgi:hypothetical protein
MKDSLRNPMERGVQEEEEYVEIAHLGLVSVGDTSSQSLILKAVDVASRL